MAFNSNVLLVTAACTALLSACVPYPVYKTLQPAASVRVVDLQGKDIEAASVTLIASAYPYGREKTREVMLTGSDGQASFSAKREWRTEVMAIHGSEQYFWNWCVIKLGFTTLDTKQNIATPFQAVQVIQLTPGNSTTCTAKP